MIRIRFFHVLDLQKIVLDRFQRPLIINSKHIVTYILLLLSVYSPFVLIVWVKVLMENHGLIALLLLKMVQGHRH